MNKRNFVAKHMNKVARPVIHVNRKKANDRAKARREVAQAKRSWLADLI